MSITEMCAELLHSPAKRSDAAPSNPDKSFESAEKAIKKYNGKTPRARVEGNRNYYDHNILGLTNRVRTDLHDGNGDPIFANARPLTQLATGCVCVAAKVGKERIAQEGHGELVWRCEKCWEVLQLPTLFGRVQYE